MFVLAGRTCWFAGVAANNMLPRTTFQQQENVSNLGRYEKLEISILYKLCFTQCVKLQFLLHFRLLIQSETCRKVT
jgi:hypothetical protein